MLERIVRTIVAGGSISLEEALAIGQEAAPLEIHQAADLVRRTLHRQRLDLCSIVNARSGRCSEDCKYCAQSKHYPAEVSSYEIIDSGEAVALARQNEAYGVQRFSLVTAGRTVSLPCLGRLGSIYRELRRQTNMSLCASMGFLTPEKALALREMGVVRYHCNLETARSYFPFVCTTHSWEEKAATIAIAREAGLEVCSGGIIGMGETFRQRLEMAFELRDLGIVSIPINILTPIPHTPFANLAPLSLDEVLTAVAMFRLINPLAIIRLAGGRGLLGDHQHRCFSAGANGAIVGDYLTTSGRKLAEDLAIFAELGFDLVVYPPTDTRGGDG